MAKDSVVQIRMDTELKEEVEELYREMGTSFPEAVRMFAAQSVRDQAMPFTPSAEADEERKEDPGTGKRNREDAMKAYEEFQQFRGILPADFDYKQELLDALDEKYGTVQ